MISLELFLVIFWDVVSQSFSENLGIPMSILRGLYIVDEDTVVGWSSALLEYGVDIALGSLNVEGLKLPNISGVAGISEPKFTLFRVRRGRLSTGWASSSEDGISVVIYNNFQMLLVRELHHDENVNLSNVLTLTVH